MHIAIRHTLPRVQRLKSKRSIDQLFAEGTGGFVYPIRYRLLRLPLTEGESAQGETSQEEVMPSTAPQGESLQGEIAQGNAPQGDAMPSETLQGEVQVMVSVSKRQHKRANVRNLLKRRMREAYRLQKEPLRAYCRTHNQQIYLALLYSVPEKLDYAIIESAIGRILQKITEQQ